MKEGDTIAIFRYAKVIGSYPNEIHVKDLFEGNIFVIKGQKLIDDTLNATTATETEKVSRTRLEEILNEVGQKPFTVCFIKQNGEKREMTALRLGDGNFGRTLVHEFETSEKKLVDHRTLQWVVVDGKKYEVK